LNRFAYTEGNPTNWVDPSGNFVPFVVGAIIGAAGAYAIDEFLSPQTVSNGNVPGTSQWEESQRAYCGQKAWNENYDKAQLALAVGSFGVLGKRALGNRLAKSKPPRWLVPNKNPDVDHIDFGRKLSAPNSQSRSNIRQEALNGLDIQGDLCIGSICQKITIGPSGGSVDQSALSNIKIGGNLKVGEINQIVVAPKGTKLSVNQEILHNASVGGNIEIGNINQTVIFK
jgi:hypothetical protein